MRRTLRSITMSLVAVSGLLACLDSPKSDANEHTLTRALIKNSDSVLINNDTLNEWIDVFEMDSNFLNKMAYADTANFMHEKMYPCAQCLLRTKPANALIKATKIAKNKGYRLVIFDCFRPVHIQRKMYLKVKNQKYVADPEKGSMHNRGAAVDLSLANMSSDKLLDMGSNFDDFTEKAAFDYKHLNTSQKNNRNLLKQIMIEAGFSPYKAEWWHFNYKGDEYPISDQKLPCEQ